MHRLVLLLVGVLVVALACGPAPQAPSGQQSGLSGPKQGGTLNVSRDDPTDFDLTWFGKGNGTGKEWSYQSLLRFSAGADVKYSDLIIRPELAERWEVSPDAKTYTFHLRKGARFHDLPPVNGREVTAEDVKWTFEYATRTGQFADKKLPQSQFDWMFESLDRVEVTGPYTAAVHFKRPFVPFLSYAASDYNPIMAKDLYERDGHLKDHLIGTGPWQLDVGASQKGTRWVWNRNPTYWEQGKPYIDQIRVLVLHDDAAQRAAFQTKQLDWLSYEIMSPVFVKEVRQRMPEVQTYEYVNPGGYHIHWNLRNLPLSEQRVRKAIDLAIDRDELSMTEFGIKSQWAPAGSLLGLFTDAEARQMLKYDPAEAKRLLAEAGYPNGVELEWDFPGPRYGEAYNSRIQLIQAQLKKANINITLKSLDSNEFSQNRKIAKFTMNLTTLDCGDPQDFDSHIFACYHSTSKNNYAGLKDPELDKMLEAQRSEVNPEKRREILRTAVKLINEKTYGVDLFYAPRWQAWHPYLKGYAPNAGRVSSYAFDNAWLDK